MGIGASIFMICVGAVLTFGIRRHFMIMNWVDINLVGWVLMLGGLIGLVITLSFSANNRRQTHVVERHHHDPPSYNPPPYNPAPHGPPQYNPPPYNPAPHGPPQYNPPPPHNPPPHNRPPY